MPAEAGIQVAGLGIGGTPLRPTSIPASAGMTYYGLRIWSGQQWKIELIAERNPEWRDLYPEIAS